MPKGLLLLGVSALFASNQQAGAQPRKADTVHTENPVSCRWPNSTYLLDSLGIDVPHPKNFVEISEVSTRGRVRLIHGYVSRPNGVCEQYDRVGPEVDRDSKLVIHIDQQFLRLATFEGNFGITGAIETSSGSRAIEIPGYSVIGKASDAVPVSVGATSDIRIAMEEFSNQWGKLSLKLDQARDDADKRQKLEASAANEIRRLEPIVSNIRSGALTLQSQLTASTRAADSSAILLKITANRDSLVTFGGELRGDSTTMQQGSNKAFLTSVQNLLNAETPTRIPLQMIGSPQNSGLVKLYARSINRPPEVIVRLAFVGDSLWNAISKEDLSKISGNTDSLAFWRSTVNNLETSLDNLARPTDSKSQQGLVTLAVGAMKDAELVIRQTGAISGDRISLTFTDSIPGQPSSARSMLIQVVVREFGFVQHASDAVLLMNLPGLEEHDAVATAQAAANSSGQAQSLTFPVSLRGSTAAGVTFGWTYVPRLDDEQAKMPPQLRTFFAWLHPGFGFNAAVPSVPHKAITLTPSKPSTEETKSAELTYTAGVILSLFDNAIAWSVGRNLTGDRTRTYTALGISFLAATSKARELFKALEQ